MSHLAKILFSTLLLTVFVFAAGCPSPDWPKCESDDHCKEKGESEMNYVCVFGKCQECGRDTDCRSPTKCRKNRCVELCTDDASCGPGMMCTPSGECEQKTGTAPGSVDKNGACADTADCKEGLTCFEDTCLTEDEADKRRAESDAAAAAAAAAAAGEGNGSDGGDGDAACQDEARIRFEFNMFDLTDDAQASLDGFSKCLAANTSYALTIEGHADERGTTQYNLDLGQRRAEAAKSYLKRLGVEASRLRAVSYGEERPVDEDSSESAWSSNRRGELRLKR